MQIIIIGKRGEFKGVTISRFWGYIAGVLSASIVVGFVVLGISVSNHDVINGQVIDNWQRSKPSACRVGRPAATS